MELSSLIYGKCCECGEERYFCSRRVELPESLLICPICRIAFERTFVAVITPYNKKTS